ncbi:DNA cytosine methyltransferase [Hyella patelloides]|uniref:DNA cytosine methyltransferase n=1 Tax=Hyella patelloides TaxID=1982969 RepID=UPI00319DF8BE
MDAKCVFSSELDKYAQTTYQADFREICYRDITTIKTKLIPDFDILLEAFPVNFLVLLAQEIN